VKEVTKAAAPAAVPAAKEVTKAAVQPQVAVPPAVSKAASAATVTRPVSKEVTTPAPAAVAAPPPVAALPSHPAGEATPKPASEPLRQQKAPVASGNPRKAPTVSYTLQIGDYVVKSTLVEVKGKLVQAGLEPVVEQGPKKKEPMVRLYVGEFPNQAAAKNEVQKLRALKVEGFFLVRADGTCQVYAGSYADEKGATRELRRLAALGRKFTLKPVTVAVPTFMLTAGTFPTRSEAQNKAQELEKQGVKAVVIERAAPEQY
jgi:cell division septation protein DedD